VLAETLVTTKNWQNILLQKLKIETIIVFSILVCQKELLVRATYDSQIDFLVLAQNKLIFQWSFERKLIHN
jgi:hypothetical protein